jgi:hypothetical protein
LKRSLGEIVGRWETSLNWFPPMQFHDRFNRATGRFNRDTHYFTLKMKRGKEKDWGIRKRNRERR